MSKKQDESAETVKFWVDRPDDFLYDDIGSGLLVNEVRRKRQELFESLSLYYRVFILHEDVSGLLEEE